MKNNIFIIFDEYKIFVDENYKKSKNKDNFIVLAELSGNILYAALLELTTKKNFSCNDIKNHISISSIINIAHNNNVDIKTKETLIYYVNNIIPNIEHVMVESFINEFLVSFAKNKIFKGK